MDIGVGHEKVSHPEGHLQLGSELEIGAVEVEAHTGDALEVVRIKTEHIAHVVLPLLGDGGQVEGILRPRKHVCADVVHNTRRLELDHQGQVHIDGTGHVVLGIGVLVVLQAGTSLSILSRVRIRGLKPVKLMTLF